MIEIKGKKIGIIGLGISGFDTGVFLLENGAKVYVSDININQEIEEKSVILREKGAEIEIGKHSPEFFKDVEFIVISPGVDERYDFINCLKERNIPIISEIELAYNFSKSKKIIAITGTNGKTTTTTLVGEVFKKANYSSVVCGNIGNTFIGEIKNIDEKTWVIIEVSSFQLEKIINFRPYISCLLNIDYDHFDRYSNMEQYIKAKKRIFINQTNEDYSVLNFDDYYTKKIMKEIKSKKTFFSFSKIFKGIYYENGSIYLKFNNKNLKILETKNLKISGKGNIANIMACSLISFLSGVEPEIIKIAIENFEGLPHRMEKITEIDGITFINDSKSTNPLSVKNSILSLDGKNNIILILGGKDKGFPYYQLTKYLKNKVKFIILFGEAKERIKKELKSLKIPIEYVENLKEAVILSKKIGKKGDYVLFSPGCSSFDMFKNYKERGDVFKKEVLSLH
ncbi:MAG: UDP-N-acetylmuramoyl-L-alanine--D-glutamate ligase [Candidatus Omnitrophica bacterium]|nr:UDP-N-acetylmuramoyl-L-alanine--D-glutamate ligase [Candidatus Omnitrophota bacterium]MCM8810352.1 UDP-N-acetylmuramoyl-L-alanine--D-glutamate ligase [Candidatus Omnitrophota bacterium]